MLRAEVSFISRVDARLVIFFCPWQHVPMVVELLHRFGHSLYMVEMAHE